MIIKSNKLSAYIEAIESAMLRKDNGNAKRLCETVIRKLSALSFTPFEEHIFYDRFGGVCHRFGKYSESLDFYYKSFVLTLRHKFEPAYAAYSHVMLGTNLMLLRNVNSAVQQFHKAEQYFNKYGTAVKPMDADAYYAVMMGLAYCHLYRNEPEKAREIIEKKLDYQQGLSSNKYFPINYYHLKGEYQIAVKDNRLARQYFNECMTFSEELKLHAAGLEAMIHIAFIDMLENKYKTAEGTLKSVIKDAGKSSLKELAGEASLLLSKCYTFMDLPEKAMAVERTIKPFLSKIDIGWLYERSREYEHLYNRLHSIDRQENPVVPEILTHTIKDRSGKSMQKDIVIGGSPVMRDIYSLMEKVASIDLPVLIQGETGTGKELIARAIHYNGSRKDKNLMALNCGALPETLLESELFGHVKGAFTGAVQDKKGYIEAVSGGTLFLDEIADMSLAMQQRLLRVLEEKIIWKIGSEKPVSVDTRFVFASNMSVEELTARKLFREDLFYRINTIIINIPPLRERKEDIPLLARYFLRKYSVDEKNVIELPGEIMDVMCNYNWPGNIRELENEMKRICIFHRGKPLVEKPMLSEAIRACSVRHSLPDNETGKGLKELKTDFEREIIRKTLEKCGGNISMAARRLKYNRSELHKKIKTLKIIS